MAKNGGLPTSRTTSQGSVFPTKLYSELHGWLRFSSWSRRPRQSELCDLPGAADATGVQRRGAVGQRTAELFRGLLEYDHLGDGPSFCEENTTIATSQPELSTFFVFIIR